MAETLRKRASGSRYLYEPFDSAHARVETLERVLDERWASLERILEQIEQRLERLERRIWIAVCGVAAFLTAEFVNMVIRGFPLP